MSELIWNELRESLLNQRIEEFNDIYGRYPTSVEEYSLEMDISEAEMREQVQAFYNGDEE